MVSMTANDTCVKVGEGIHLYRPTEPGPIKSSHPTVVLIFGWMAARFSHLQKYTSIYRERYPNTTLVLTQCEPSFFWSSQRAQHKALAPLVDVLEALGLIHPLQEASKPRKTPLDSIVPLPTHRILLHVFSNGGCCQLMILGSIISNRRAASLTTATHTPASALILDSCPGDGGFSSAERAFTISVTNPLLRMLVKLGVIILFSLRLVMEHVFRQQSAIPFMRSQLNDPDMVPWLNKNSPRLYIYSEGDEMVPVHAVEQHMKDAVEKGFNVQPVKFGKESKHVAHARSDPSRYWGATEQMWKEAIGVQD
ncbi:hypothetical protein AGABI2DRAFT_191067 [Agaricus bisporus var. bisporus H97]|uniref:hypothetical protein n=1 Tax=Agaricus bisporus var. bisporus (strain H97 / ATCC MYA-4626 / FGSC 10389) TaxID=936046 RepID=UPI00029F586E|nr:hypothetical protein AGABI2DRAFT_191067 [Agaricus bisporus var. bisporus H97]EKV48889.1 hypothetical protein AGABI2DRAFT_191067 [Agaricus bisporus var. bisporus H97]